MNNHFLTRNPENEPVCSCGYRPDILDTGAPVGRMWKAKALVLNHVDAMNALHGHDTTETPRRSPDAPFTASSEAEYPRAGVRPMRDGRWLLTLWDSEDTQHPIPDPAFDDLSEAFDYAWLTIGACRQSGTSLNGLEAA